MAAGGRVMPGGNRGQGNNNSVIFDIDRKA